MTDTAAVQERAERVFRSPLDQHEKGSAMAVIKADTEATQAKTSRLRALRLSQESTEAEAPAKKPAAKRKPARKGRV